MDSGDEDDRETEPPLSLTGFLFGNIDQKGQLEDDDVLDQESKRHLNQLNSLGGFGSLVQEITADTDNNGDDEQDSQTSSSGWVLNSPSAVDYSDINEAVDEQEIRQSMGSLRVPQPDRQLMPPPASSLVTKATKMDSRSSPVEEFKGRPSPHDERDAGNSLFADAGIILPSVVPTSTNGEITRKEEDNLVEKGDGKRRASDSSPELNWKRRRSMEKSPSGGSLKDALFKGKDLPDVTVLFPHFRHGKVLRFNKLFGPGKPSSLPQIWRGAKRRRKRRRPTGEEPEEFQGWEFDYGPIPPPDQWMSDDEEKMMRPMEALPDTGTRKEATQDEDRPEIPEWRFGPARYWYDMLGYQRLVRDSTMGSNWQTILTVTVVTKGMTKEKSQQKKNLPNPPNLNHRKMTLLRRQKIRQKTWKPQKKRRKSQSPSSQKRSTSTWWPSGPGRMILCGMGNKSRIKSCNLSLQLWQDGSLLVPVGLHSPSAHNKV
ncbi:Transcription initiation factor TFIID subunit 1 [Branchiostoma belcheri]|nr:Transcription initiation factor TFIID subunit 1 [Branchiostoma belcheri]